MGVGYHPSEHLHQDCGHDHPDAAQRVGQDVKEDAFHDLRVSTVRQVHVDGVIVRVAVAVRVVRVTVRCSRLGVAVRAATVTVAVLEGVDSY